MVTTAPLPYNAELRTGGLQPLVAVLPAALSRHGLLWSPEDASGTRELGPLAVDALRGPRSVARASAAAQVAARLSRR